MIEIAFLIYVYENYTGPKAELKYFTIDYFTILYINKCLFSLLCSF